MSVNMLAESVSAPHRQHRNVHLDFHNSPLIPDLAAAFDAKAFARTFADAHVTSVTIFAKCHHGMCYYPTRTGTMHPALAGRDLLGEQIEALHRVGIRAPIYTTVGWDEDAAARHPAWRQLLRDGSPAVSSPGAPWKFLNFVHPDYLDYLEAHLREVRNRYGDAVDGVFLDGLAIHPDGCHSEASVRFRARKALSLDSPGGHERFQAAAQEAFAQRFTPLLRDLLPPRASVFYNAPCDVSLDSSVGPRPRYPLMTHAEIESLPTGHWGYQHFPRVARAISHWGKPWLGLTGRFFKAWGDFGGIKPLAALEFECFRAQALGGGTSVGDQLHPRGSLDPDAYALIRTVYAQVEAAAGFYEGSEPLPNFGSLCASYPGLARAQTAQSDEGAMLMASEMHRDVAMLDDLADFAGFRLIQLPDCVVVTPLLAEKLRDYYRRGGNLLLSHRSGFDADGRWALGFLPFTITEAGRDVESYPTYWRAGPEMLAAVGRGDRVCYLPGVMVHAGQGARTMVERVLPCLRRTQEAFSPHRQVPPASEADVSPAVIAGERFVYYADPIFREFRLSGNAPMRNSWHVAMNILIGPPPYGDGLPKTVQIFPRRRGNDLLLTLLHYIPVRKSLELDLIEERSSFAGESLRLPPGATTVRPYGGPPLPRADDGTFTLPAVKGRLLIEVPDFFAAA